MTALKVLITRPEEEGSDEIVAAVLALGFEPLREPLLKIVPIEAFRDTSDGAMTESVPLEGIAALSDPDTALIFTSAHGVRLYTERVEGRSIQVFTVGDNTTDAATKAGFTDVTNASGGADQLAALLTDMDVEIRPKRLIYVRGEDIARPLCSLLEAAGYTVEEIILYKAVASDTLSLECLKALDRHEIVAVLHFSARTAQILSDLVEQYGRTPRFRTIKALCIGESVIQSLSVLPYEETLISEIPNRHGMIELLGRLKAKPAAGTILRKTTKDKDA